MRPVLGTLLLWPILCCHLAFGQSSAVGWSTIDMGYARTTSGNMVVKSVAGQSFVGGASLGNMMASAGFLVDTLAGARVLGVHDGATIPTAFALRQNYPNPFNPTTTIQFELPRTSHVVLKLYNILGQVVEQVISDDRPAGIHRVTVDGRRLASGVYFYRLEATAAGGPSFTQTKKMMLLK